MDTHERGACEVGDIAGNTPVGFILVDALDGPADVKVADLASGPIGIELFLGERVVEELTEQRGYISIDRIDKARTTDWVTIVDPVQPGVRVHDGPRAGVVMDRVHQRLAMVEQVPPDELRKTDAELAAVAVMLLGSTPHDSIGILMDDKNAERAIAGVITNTYYEGRARMLNIWDAIVFMES